MDNYRNMGRKNGYAGGKIISKTFFLYIDFKKVLLIDF